uniref:Uncharacterized protein n=1 Tax=Manihot esculenta TaxID=3983 RepID=A0A2C9WKR9_MANES
MEYCLPIMDMINWMHSHPGCKSFRISRSTLLFRWLKQMGQIRTLMLETIGPQKARSATLAIGGWSPKNANRGYHVPLLTIVKNKAIENIMNYKNQAIKATQSQKKTPKPSRLTHRKTIMDVGSRCYRRPSLYNQLKTSLPTFEEISPKENYNNEREESLVRA